MFEQLTASVGLCTYNSEKFLRSQIDSILAQNCPVAEIVVIDDFSTDSTQQILREYDNRHPGLFRLIFNEENQGARKNFEQLLILCKGDIVFLSDHDDVWLPHKVTRMTAHFKEHPEDKVLFTNAVVIDENGVPLPHCLLTINRFTAEAQSHVKTKEDLLRYMLRHDKLVTGATLAIKKEFIPKLVPFKMMQKFWHDAWIGFAAVSEGALNYINEPLIHYRIHSEQQVGCGEKLVQLMQGAAAIPPLMRNEMNRTCSKEDLIQLVHTRRKRVRLYKRLSNFLHIKQHIIDEIYRECQEAERAFKSRSFVVRWKQSLNVMLNRPA
jgi:glycosyltransferase involved in cell wall biosynthesis